MQRSCVYEKGGAGMRIKGVIFEDDKGREFVMVCGELYPAAAKVFALKGWQRRRLVPLQYTERELRHIARGVHAALRDIIEYLSTTIGGVDDNISNQANCVNSLPKPQKASLHAR